MHDLSPSTRKALQSTYCAFLAIIQDHKGTTFTFTGVDFAGPLYVKGNGEMRKNYVSVYTCAVSRAVHLDTVPDLTAQAFIRNFRRFAARRGLPRELNSDNGKTFVSVSKMLRALFNSPAVRRHLANKGVKWTVLRGPHGGVVTLND